MTQRMRRRVLVAGTLAAAGLTGAARVDAMQGGKLKIALVLKSLADPFTVAMANAAQNYQKHYASQFDLTVRGTATEGDTAAQIRMVDELIKARMNAIVIAPTDSKALTAIVARGIKAGIIMVTIDNPLDDASQDAAHISVPFVGPNNRKGAKQVGDYLAAAAQGGRSGRDHRRHFRRPQCAATHGRQQGRDERGRHEDRRHTSGRLGLWERTGRCVEDVSRLPTNPCVDMR